MNELHDTRAAIKEVALLGIGDEHDIDHAHKNRTGCDEDAITAVCVDIMERALTAEAANRKQKAEIERILRNSTDLVGCAEVDRIFAIQRAEKAEAELASLRASVGEKPEDAYKRGQEDMMKRVILPSFYSSYPPGPYVAPTLPGEKESR